MITTKNKIWFAGFMDGEGSFIICRDKRGGGDKIPVYNPMLSVSTIDKSTMYYIKNKFDGRLYIIKPKNPKHKTVYRVDFRGSNNTLRILDMINPFLITKKKHTEILYKFIKFKKSHLRKDYIRLTSTDLETLDKMFLELSSINMKKGIHLKHKAISRIHFCLFCKKPLPENTTRKTHITCYKKNYGKKFGLNYRKKWWRTYLDRNNFLCLDCGKQVWKAKSRCAKCAKKGKLNPNYGEKRGI